MQTFEEIKKEAGNKSYKTGLVEFIRSLNNDVCELSENNEKHELENEVINLLKQADKELQSSNDSKFIEKVLTSIWKCKVITGENQSSDYKNALGHFVEGIYKDSFHFFLELIQNADDASKDSENGRLHIAITKEHQIKFKYDDRGFNFSDLFAITSLGNSTKKGKLDANAEIGEKGIGFKSIFAIATRVDIKSKYFSFSIQADKDNLQNMLLPRDVNLENTLNEEYSTILTLTLREELKNDMNFWKNIDEWMSANVKCKEYANPFMFLKNIKQISYQNENNEEENSAPIKIERKIIESKEESFYIESIDEKRYFVYKTSMQLNKEAILSRWEYLKEELSSKPDDYTINREMQVAFPIFDDEKEKLKLASELPKGKFYSYLPTNITFDFPIFINLDIHLTASRGNISSSDFATGSVWNEQVLKKLPECLKNAYLSIIKSYNNEKDEDLRKLGQYLYNYIPNDIKIEDTTNMQNAEQEDKDKKDEIIKGFEERLEAFKTELIKCPIILDINDEFKKIDEVKIICSKAEKKNNGILVCKDEYKCSICNEKIENIYLFMKKTEKDYPKNNEWNKLLNDIKRKSIKDKDYYDSYKIVNMEEGFLNFWNNRNIDEEKKKNIINQLIEDIKDKSLKQGEYPSLNIIPIEDIENDDGFIWTNIKEQEEKGKAIFFHNKKIKEDENNSVYVIQDKFDKDNLKDLLENYYNIIEYNLNTYYNNCVKKFFPENCNIDEEYANEFIRKTFNYYFEKEKCYNIEEQLPEIKEYFGKFTLPWVNYLERLKDNPCEEYINLLNNENFLKENNLELSKWNIDSSFNDFDDNKKIKYIEYLTWLGLKYKPEIVDKNIDNYTKAILESNIVKNKISVDKKTRKLCFEEDKLCEYLISFLNKNNCSDCFKYVEKMIKQKDGKEIRFVEKDKIETINKKIEELTGKENDKPQIEDSNFFWISDYGIENIVNQSDKKVKKENYKEFFCSFLYNNFLKFLRISKIMNETFKETFGEGSYKKQINLSLSDFLSCYNELEEENLEPLMKEGYKIDDLKYDEEIVSESTKVFLKNLLGLKDDEKFEIPKIAVVKKNQINRDKMTKSFIDLDKINNIENVKYLIKQPDNYPKSGVLFVILKEILKYKITESQEKEIKDYFGELKENKPVIMQSKVVGEQQYCDGVFFEYHRANIEKAQEYIKSIWEKDILEQLCSPYELTNNEVMEGYGYICPICGRKSKAALSGLKFKRYKHNNETYPYLYIVSCMDCYSMLTYAKSIEILDFNKKMEKFNDYYCADDKHMKNHSKMTTVDLKVKIWNDTEATYKMKVSYLNMVLYKKMENTKKQMDK